MYREMNQWIFWFPISRKDGLNLTREPTFPKLLTMRCLLKLATLLTSVWSIRDVSTTFLTTGRCMDSSTSSSFKLLPKSLFL